LFADIYPTNTYASPFSYYIRLPTETRIVLNSTGDGVNLNTSHGSDDWHSSTAQSSVDAVWDHAKSFRKPTTLKPPEICNVNANTELESTSGILEKIAQEATCWPKITS
jgi:hypothetical protein